MKKPTIQRTGYDRRCVCFYALSQFTLFGFADAQMDIDEPKERQFIESGTTVSKDQLSILAGKDQPKEGSDKSSLGYKERTESGTF